MSMMCRLLRIWFTGFERHGRVRRYEQEHNADSRSFGSCPPPSVQSICWELHSFLKLHGRTGALVFHWFRAALEQLLPLLVPLDAGEPAIEHARCPAAAQAAAYRASMLSVVRLQLLQLDGCDAAGA
jgi:hypothetical protein